jgi:uncharacterized membrane protein
MIPLCSRFDSVLFTPKMSAIACHGNYSRSPTVWWHASANVLVVLIELYNLFSRYQQGPSAIVPNGLLLSLIAVLLLLFSGWKGGDLVFRGHVGVADN